MNPNIMRMRHIKFLFALVIAAMTGASAWADINPTVTLDNGVILTFEIEKVDTTDCQLIRLNDTSIGVGETYTLNIPATITYQSRSYFVTEVITRFCEGNTKIKGLSVPSSVKTIGQYAFKDCTSLETIVLSEGVEDMGLAFQNTGIVEMPELPSTVTNLVGTFSHCTKLKRAVIPSTIKYLQNPFYGCTAMEDVYFNITSWKTTVFNNPVLTSQIETLFGYLPNETVRIHVSEEIYMAFKNKLTSWYFYTSQKTEDNPCSHLVVDGMVKVGDRGLALVEAVDKTTGAVGARYAVRIVYISVNGERKAIIYGGEYTSTENLDENPCWHGYTSEWGVHYSGAFEKLDTPTAYSNMRLSLPSKVEDSHGNIYTVIGLGAFATYYCSFYGVEEVRIPKTYTHLGCYSLRNFSNLQNYIVIPSSVKQIGSPAKKSPTCLFADESSNTSEDNRLMSVYFLHRDADVTWYETSTNQYFRWKNYDNRYVYLRVNQSIIDTYCGSDASWNGFKAWSNYVMTGSDKTSHQKLATQPVWNPEWVAYISGTQKHYEPGEYSLTVYNSRFRLPITAEHFYSTDESIVEILGAGTASNGDVALYYKVKSAGEADIVFHYPGDDVFDELTSTATIISKSETLCGDQTLNNSYNTVGAPSTGVTMINLASDKLYNYDEEYEKAAMTIADGKLYVSLSSNEYYLSYYGGLILQSSPELLTPNYGADYRTAYATNGSEGVSEMVAGVDYGGLLCFKVPSGKGVITVEGSLYDSQSILGIRVVGNAEKRLTNSNEWEYDYDVAEDSWAYIYGINLGEKDSYRAYISSIIIHPDGVPMPKVSILGQDVNNYSNLSDLLGDGGSVAFNWGYPGDTESTEETAQAATLILNNASLINNDGPAIEVNSLNTFIILVEGDNTVRGTGAASISMGTLSGYDWDGTALIIASEENAASLTIPSSAQYGVYSYDGAAQIFNLTSVDVSGTECGFYINNVSGASGGGGVVSKAADNTKSVDSYNIGQLVINNVQSAKFSGAEAAVYGLSVAPESNDESDCSIVEIVPEDAVFNSFVGSYVVGSQTTTPEPIKGIEGNDEYEFATMVHYGSKAPAITIFGRGITKEDFLNSPDGTIALNQEGTAVLTWEELEYNGSGPKSSKSDTKGDVETLYDYGYPVLTLNGANINYTGSGSAIEVNTYPGFFIRVKGNNTITATNAKTIISVGTSRGYNDTSSQTSLFIMNDDEQAGETLPSLTINNNRSTKGDGIYVCSGSVEVQNCAVDVNAPTYALRYFYDSSSSGGSGPKKAISFNRDMRSVVPQKVVVPDGPVGNAGYLNIYAGSELTLNGSEAALWGVTGYSQNDTYYPGYLQDVGLIGSDKSTYENNTNYSMVEGPIFFPAGNYYSENLSFNGSYYIGCIKSNDDLEIFPCKYLKFAKDSFIASTPESVLLKFMFTGDNTVQVGKGDDNCVVSTPDDWDGTLTVPSTVTDDSGKSYSVKGLADKALYDWSELQSVTISEGIEYIGTDMEGWGVFEGDYNLTTVSLPSTTKSLAEWCFNSCDNITDVYLFAEDAPSLNDYIFSSSNNAILHVPAGTKVAYVASDWANYFGNGERIVEMEGISPIFTEVVNGIEMTFRRLSVDGETHKGTACVYGYVDYSANEPTAKPAIESSYEGAIAVPETVMHEIDGEEIEYTIVSLSSYAFAQCEGLTSVTIPNTVTTIGEGAFAFCPSLKTVTLGSNVQTIDGGAFFGCNSIQSMTSNASDVPALNYADDTPHPFDSFTSLETKPTLYVPAGCAAAYQTGGWTTDFFAAIVEMGGSELEPGDVSGDGEINVSDVTALVSIILGNSSGFTESQRKAADLNKDGEVNVSDITTLVSIILNQ